MTAAMAGDGGTWGRVLASARFSLGVVCASLASLSCLVLALWMRFSPVNREVDMAQNATFILRLPQLYKSTILNDIFMSNMIPLNAVVFFPQFVFLPCRVPPAMIALCCTIMTIRGVTSLWLAIHVLPSLKLLFPQVPFVLPVIFLRLLLPDSQVWIVSLLLWVFFIFATLTVSVIVAIPSEDIGVRLLLSSIVLPFARELTALPIRVMVRAIVGSGWLRHESVTIYKTYTLIFPLGVLASMSGLARLLAASIPDWRLNVGAIVTMTCVEVFMRLTLEARDEFLMRALSKILPCARMLTKQSFKIVPKPINVHDLINASARGGEEQNGSGLPSTQTTAGQLRRDKSSSLNDEQGMSPKEATSLILICEMIGEYMSIICSTVVILLFAKTPLNYPFQAYADSEDIFSGQLAWSRQLWVAAGMVIGEIVADTICVTYETAVHKLPVLETWQKLSPRVIFLCVGIASSVSVAAMAVGSILASGSSADCTSMNVCYCMGTPSMRSGSLRERYCERLYPLSAGEPYGLQAAFITGYETGLEWPISRIDAELVRPLRDMVSLATVISTGSIDSFPATEESLELGRLILDRDFGFKEVNAMAIFVLVEGLPNEEPAIVARNGTLCEERVPMVSLRAPTANLFRLAVDDLLGHQNASFVPYSHVCP